jgi:putative ABC transport system permease protein
MGIGLLNQTAQDVRYALRSWWREPLFALTAGATYALGIAIAAAIGAVAYGVLVKPLPLADPDRLVKIGEAARGGGNLSYPDFLELRRATRSLERVAGFNGVSRTLVRPGDAPDRVVGTEVTEGFFALLGVRMMLGRDFRADEAAPQGVAAAVLSHAAWQRRFGSDPAVVGRTITLDGQAWPIVGVLPADFEFPLRRGVEVWLPARPSTAQLERRYQHWLDVVGRMSPGVSPDQLRADLDLVSRMLASDDPKWHTDVRFDAVSLHAEMVRGVRPALLILLGAAAMLLAAACANVAGLVVARARSRDREMSVRAAIGAGPVRLVRQLTTEGVMLAVAGTALGLLLGDTLVHAAIASLPAQQKQSLLRADRLGVTPEIAAAALVFALAIGVLLGVLPALLTRRRDLAVALTSRSGGGRSGARTRVVLVAVEVALALVLVAGAGLLGRSVYRLLQVSPGFDPRGLLTFRVVLPGAKYPDLPSRDAARERLLEAFRALPGVRAASTIDQLPLTGTGNNGSLQVVGRPGYEGPTVLLRTVGAEYFDTMGIALRDGRRFTRQDRVGAPRVALVNQTLSSNVFGSSNAVGQRISFPFIPDPLEIVGVVSDEQFAEIDRPRNPVVYLPAAQDAGGPFTVVIRADRAESLAPAVARTLAVLEPAVPAAGLTTVEKILQQSNAVFLRRAVLALLGLFATSALMLAAVGVYGTLAYVVTQRMREIGIRIALGAERRDVVRLVLGRAVAPVAAGAALGIAVSAAAARFLKALLFGVAPYDPATLLGAVVCLSAVAAAACAIPVLRAARIDPAITLRQE